MSSIGASSSLQAASQNNPESGLTVDQGLSSLSTEEFTEIILTEMSNQDPLAPNDTQALLDQLSSIMAIESDTRLNDAIESLVERDEFATAAGVIGLEVRGLDENGSNVQDLVRSVSQGTDGVVLNLDGGGRMAFGEVSEIVQPVAPVGDDAGSTADDDEDGAS